MLVCVYLIAIGMHLFSTDLDFIRSNFCFSIFHFQDTNDKALKHLWNRCSQFISVAVYTMHNTTHIFECVVSYELIQLVRLNPHIHFQYTNNNMGNILFHAINLYKHIQ